MKTIITFLLIALSLTAISQIGNYVQVQVISANQYTIKNLQSCTTSFKVRQSDLFFVLTPPVPPNGFVTMEYSTCGGGQVWPLVLCNDNAVMEGLEINTCFVLPVYGIEKFEANRSQNGFNFLLKLASEKNVSRIEILTGVDKNNLHPLLEFKPDGRMIYYPTITLK